MIEISKIVRRMKCKRIFLITLLLLISVFSFAQSRYISATTKRVVFARDGGQCRCCGSSASLEYDHIIPFSCGGSSEISNIQLLCMRCNRSKSNSCVCKIHNRIVGSNCCSGSSGGVTRSTTTTSATSQQCTGITQKGARCRNRTRNPSGRCHLH